MPPKSLISLNISQTLAVSTIFIQHLSLALENYDFWHVGVNGGNSFHCVVVSGGSKVSDVPSGRQE